ncbi:prolipoprotein diacylglyceryl transferase [Patescibacteria group bacterium]|nr:prolipoprotein diacylglyceryl transferase [Patescibacteria group bacterium]
MEFAKITSLSIGPVNIQVWGLLVALGMLAALLLTLHEAKNKKLHADNFVDLFIIIFISGMLGAKLLHILEFWPNYVDKLYGPIQVSEAETSKFMILIGEGGFVLFGGVIFAALGVYIFTKLKKLSFWKTVDTMAPGIALGLAIGRIGAYLMGDHIGSRTTFFLGSYYNGDLRHEPSLYLSINAFIMFIALMLIAPFVRKKEGVLAYLMIVWYSVARFVLDFTRAADIDTISISDPRYFGLTLSQIACLLLFVIFTPLLVKKLKCKDMPKTKSKK